MAGGEECWQRSPWFGTVNPQFRVAITELDSWAGRIDRIDPTGGTALPSHRLVVATKARSVADACWTADGRKIAERQVPGIDNTRCNTLYQVWPSPRMVAGGPLANDVIACTTKRLDPRDYRVRFTAGQWRTLQQTLPYGVCNWQRPGVGQTGAIPKAWPVFTG